MTRFVHTCLAGWDLCNTAFARHIITTGAAVDDLDRDLSSSVQCAKAWERATCKGRDSRRERGRRMLRAFIAWEQNHDCVFQAPGILTSATKNACKPVSYTHLTLPTKA